MYPHSQRGYRQFPGLTEYTTLLALTDEGNSLDIGTEVAETGTTLKIRPSGSRVYIDDQTNNDIEQYDLSTPGDISTGASGATFTGTGSYTSLFLIGFKESDGTLMYYADGDGAGGTTIYEETLNTGWEIDSNAGSPASKDVTSASAATANGGAMSPDGTKLFLITQPDFSIFQFSMTAYDISTLNTTPETEFDLSDYNDPAGVKTLDFNSDGTQMVVAFSNKIVLFDLGTAYDLTGTVTFAGKAGIAGKGEQSVAFMDDDTLIIAYSDETLNEHTIVTSPSERGALYTDVSGVLPIIIETGLYYLSTTKLLNYVGTISGTQRCILDTDNSDVVIANGSNPYQFDRSTLGLTEITDADLSTSDSTAYLDRRFAFDDANQFAVSALDDPTSIEAADFATAESMADDLVRVFALNQLLYLFGDHTIEVWYTSGVGRPPLDRQAVIDEMGIIGRYAVVGIDNTIYWVDEQRRLNRMVGAQWERVWVPALGEEWNSYATVNDCIVSAYTIEQENFIEITFPTADATWTYHEQSGTMCEREDTSNARFRASSYVNAFSKLLGVDHSNGKVYEFSNSTYQDDGNAITRILDTQVISSELFGAFGRQLIGHGVKYTIESTGSASIGISFSSDLSTFGTERTVTLSSGINHVEMRRWGKFTEGVFRFKTTANAGISVIDCAVDLEILGD